MTMTDPLQIGVFDHMDRGDTPLARQYEDRLKLAELYDRLGFDRMHIAEHHSTPLGTAPSPGIFLSAVAQRTRRLRFGPLVYPIKLYHPLRLAEEIAMLDHLSNGRFEFGIGKGASPIELALYGIDPANVEPQYAEALKVVMQALTQDRVDFEGQFYQFRDVPVTMHPLQRPHPPMWYGVSRPDGAARAARNAYNIVGNLPAAAARNVTDSYRAAWVDAGRDAADLPRLGIGRFIVVADSDEQAQARAARAFPRWQSSFWKLWDARGARPPVSMPDTFEGVQRIGIGVAGSARTVAQTLSAQVEEAGANYLLGRFAFGDLSFEESAQSASLFANEVMPVLKANAPATRAEPASALEG
jgi:alkanesulfonate monooxygenase SsuD/methylene tetrahydromethanopterin reductase-like flavin-dependent oxidoreductase (luciferase family)